MSHSQDNARGDEGAGWRRDGGLGRGRWKAGEGEMVCWGMWMGIMTKHPVAEAREHPATPNKAKHDSTIFNLSLSIG